MTACLFGTYVRSHSANRLLALALADAGFQPDACHVPLWETTPVKGRSYFRGASLARLAVRYARAARSLAAQWRARTGPPPVVLVGFGGQLDVLLARRICRPRAGLVFAPLVSLTETLVDDRAVFRRGRVVGRGIGALDRAGLRAADLVLADTEAHAAHFTALGARRVAVWHLGAEPEFFAAPPAAPEPRRVLFYGRYLPLHGVETIVAAAGRLGERASFVLIGTGPERPRMERLARTVRATVTFRDDVPLGDLPHELSRAAVVLGVFGAGRKAAVVVPNKVYQAAASGRPLVTREAPALREVLRPGEHCLACPPADPDALAAAVARLLGDARMAEGLGRAARTHVLELFGPERQAERLRAILADRFGPAAAPEPAPRRLAGA